MHGIKDPDLKEMTEATNEEETEIKEDTKVKHCRCSLYSDVVLTCFLLLCVCVKNFLQLYDLKNSACAQSC